MLNKKILVLCPILPEWSEAKVIADSLAFLGSKYQLELVDPLAGLERNTSFDDLVSFYKKKISDNVGDYYAFVGFSFGGVVLQKCFDILEKHNKKALLFSTPSFTDQSIADRLSSVVELIVSDSVTAAINELNRYVYYPKEPIAMKLNIKDEKLAALRMSLGFQFIIQADSRDILKRTNVSYLHFIGEKSMLVNQDNVVTANFGKLFVVKNAGMRILQSDADFCKAPIMQFFAGETP